MESATRNNRLITVCKHPLTKIMLMFLWAALPPLINLNLLLRRSGPLIYIHYNALFTYFKQLLSRFASCELVRKFANGDVTIVQIKGEIIKEKNILDTSKLFVGYLLDSKLNELLDEGGISKRDSFTNLPMRFIIIYAINNFPLQDKFSQHTLFMNFYNQKCTFQSVLSVVEKLKLYISFSDQDLCQLEAEFLSLNFLVPSFLYIFNLYRKNRFLSKDLRRLLCSALIQPHLFGQLDVCSMVSRFK